MGVENVLIGVGTAAGIKFGRADGGATFDNRLPVVLLGTFVSDTPGDGNKDTEDETLLKDSKIDTNIDYCQLD